MPGIQGAGELWAQQPGKHLVENLVADLSHVTDPAKQKRAIENLKKADEGMGRAVAVGLGLER
ncbi:MAG: hypothetical protein NTY37_07295 [Methanothrix sp.]|nr:hypothetical protein [Methanothrix sp.]